ncbi:MAG: DUF5009 domain-containing protein [Verrucomicrobiales bacterium]
MRDNASTCAAPARPGRLVSLDAFRGLVMMFMASAGLGLANLAKSHPNSPFWQSLAFHTSHVPWVGGGVWDMIQPAFMFMVGVALPFSLARRQREGQGFGRLLAHAAWRSLLLIALGVFLASHWSPHTVFHFTNVLAQIGLGYVGAFLFVGRPLVWQLCGFATLLLAAWAAFVLHPLPPGNLDWSQYGVKPEETGDVLLPGLFAHWNKGWNLAASFDRWFLNLFPSETTFVFNSGGYQTLNFVPSIATMLLGVMAGELLLSDRTPSAKLLRLFPRRGRLRLVWGCSRDGMPVLSSKRLWTPSWVLYSGGIVLWLLAAFHALLISGFAIAGPFRSWWWGGIPS